jgi:oxygen-independent coproporphyrinogen III oxidase
MRMGTGRLQGLYGIYIHIPFCVRKCPYCDFYSVTDLSLIPRFVGAVIREIEMSDRSPVAVDTIFFGGGTPSVLTAGQISDIVGAIRRCFDVSPDAEITMEVNPGTIDVRDLRCFHKAGVNRVNIGIQSFSDPALGFLGRIHSAAEGLCAFEAARCAGIDNIGIDLIFGLPGQTPALWQQDLETAVRLGPEHLSCYQLTYETGTRMSVDLDAKKFYALSEENAAEMFDQTGRFLASAGYARYEISNFAVSPSRRSRHNLKYWTFAPYLGFGPSAHSFAGCRRSWNVARIDDYLARMAAGESPTEGEEAIDRTREMTEAIYLGLRLADGISITGFNDCFQADFSDIFGKGSALMESMGLLKTENGQCRLTHQGMRFADAIAARLIEAI